MPLPLLPIIGAALAGGVIGACITRINEINDGYRYDEDGYNSFGFDKNGFDRDGFDEEGFDCEGYDKNGLDRSGYNRDGRDKDGFDQEGYDAAGFNRKGYDRAGWNAEGRDVTGLDAAYYGANVQEVTERLSKAEGFMAEGDFEHASLEIRKGAEQVVKCIISHTLGVGRYKRHFESDIDACKGALDDDVIGRLHTLRQTCSDQLHIDMRDVGGLQIDAKYVANLQSKLLFCMKTLKEALAVVEAYASEA